MRSKVRVIYKSGAVQDIRCKGFTITYTPTGGLSRVKWDKASPRPLFIGVDNIAAVYELGRTS